MSPTPPFPLYLFPSFTFRRRSSATSTSTISTSPTASLSSSPPAPTYLSRAPTAHLRCTRCLSDLIPTSSIISKGFTGRHGRAYLVSPPTLPPDSTPDGSIPNTTTHRPVSRQLVTGAHTVSDISCAVCGSVLGWKYVAAEEEGQRYKVGKFILETKRVVKGDGWEDRGEIEEEKGRKKDEEDIEFDSQDEEECEDLFAGVWSAKVAARRRAEKGVGRGL